MENFYEILGYVASFIVLVSLLMSSVKRLRWINLFGSLVFAVYGFLIGAIPVGVMNTGIAMINVYYLFQMYTKKDYFTLIEMKKDTEYFKYFMSFYRDNMKSFMNVDDHLEDDQYLKLFILRNTVPAGVVVGEYEDKHTLKILIDYVTPTYRDFKVGQFLYEDKKDFFSKLGVKKLTTHPGNIKHQAYLKKMGFIENNNVFIKEI
ncbi:GNAT family N-acetyltransferase [Peloplasma aerotolerans]|uniref:N-acetyltransferase domain-containing protein n=1 Tax=Peloplasma aerotolerans TaxID=3044389 RepID=A0AAW6U8A2_9MOLU|nr:GNAT family N-acetyltransferase [Mariniplasma sp. M4Ah]MDI6452179.1 hypothetical protein [Mariniplasma sp. M4Ah]MDR4969442.1 hypothetical protein [Acholeplasmataceae bacterium]